MKQGLKEGLRGEIKKNKKGVEEYIERSMTKQHHDQSVGDKNASCYV